MKNRMAWVLGGGAAVGMAMIAASLGACSSPGTTTDAGKDVTTTTDTGTNKDTGTTPDTGIQDAGADCKNVPSSFPFSTEAGPYCPYQADGSAPDCLLGDHCCVYKTIGVPSTCNTASTACTPGSDAGTTDFQCEETNDCTGTGQVCCLNAPGSLNQDPGCTSYWFVSHMSGTSCMTTSCGTQPQLCGSNADCANLSGKTCTPVNTKGIWIGVCK